MSATSNSLLHACRQVLLTPQARDKAAKARDIASQWRQGDLQRDMAALDEWPDRPARDVRPQLLAPQDMPRRRMSSHSGRKSQLHALAHIELNAIDLAFDLIGRFIHTDLPDAFIDDWMKVGADEARHFLMLDDRLREMDMHYGDLPAHDGLWQAAYDTREDLMGRLVIVPLVLEARGLDVTPMMMQKFAQAGDSKSAKMLEIIFEDEKTHVEAGTRWFHFLCEKQSLDPKEVFHAMVDRYFKGRLKPPFNDEARLQAGLQEHYYRM